ncbi:tryptase [Labeo rohita]|uniref:tryptase n=1 Tax=Labeo rohita TaxID=84645 RepID=UPI0021E304BB|nr:tryptase [Labeo rohita]
MWKTCVTLALLICIRVHAHGPMHPRIGGGVNAPSNAWPWMVSLHNLTYHFCGGSLISRKWVLSAAHCFFGPTVTAHNIRVYLGKWTQRERNNNEVMTTVEQIYIHNLYSTTTDDRDNDIALLLLSSLVTYNAYIRPVCLIASGSDFPPGTNSSIIGWGRTLLGERLPYPGTLQQAVVPVVNHTQCYNQLTTLIIKYNSRRMRNNLQQTYKRVTNNMICAGIPCGGVDTNMGDSGGPLMSWHNSSWVQHGITSWGFGCGLPNIPSVYTRVSQYQQWITNIISNHPSRELPQFISLQPGYTGVSGLLRCIVALKILQK